MCIRDRYSRAHFRERKQVCLHTTDNAHSSPYHNSPYHNCLHGQHGRQKTRVREPGFACNGQSARLVIEMLRVQVPTGAAEDSSARVNFVCWLLLDVRSTPVLPQWHVEDPGHSAKGADHAPDQVGGGWLCCLTGIVCKIITEHEFTRNSSGKHSASHFSSMSYRGLILALKKKKKRNWCA